MRLIMEFDYKNYIENGTVGRRPSVRGIIIRAGKIAMIYSETFRYYTFPGGGIDPGETHEQTLIREVQEEAGLAVIPESIREYGLVLRKEKGRIDDLFIQENYFYTCEVREEPVNQQLQGYEIEEKLSLRWVRPEEAISANRQEHQDEISEKGYVGHMVERDALLLEKLVEEGYFG